MPAYKMIESYMYVRLHKTNLGATQKGSAQDKKLISYDGRNSSTDHKGSDITAFSVLAKMFCFSITAAVCGGLKSSLQVYKSGSDRGSFMVVAPAMQAGLVRSPSHSCCVYYFDSHISHRCVSTCIIHRCYHFQMAFLQFFGLCSLQCGRVAKYGNTYHMW